MDLLPRRLLPRGRRGATLGRLRRDTVWVDPTVQLWNASLLDNVRFGSDPDKVSEAMEAAQIEEILGRLPMGLQTPLGASGGMLSGGEGDLARFCPSGRFKKNFPADSKIFRGVSGSRKTIVPASTNHGTR